jgi:hypothetical protein
MLFHVGIKVFDSINLDGDKRLREFLGPGFQRVMQSGKVRESGLFGGQRGGYFVVEVNEPVELYEIFGPEIYGNCAVEAHPIVPLETAGELFGRWAQEGR